MADQPEQPPLPPNAQPLQITLPHKPTASLSCTFNPGTTQHLIVFLNGLGLPQSHWWPAITHFLSVQPSSPHPSLLTYDRYGQGLTTSPDPQDKDSTKPPGHRHDIISVVNDLNTLLTLISEEHHNNPLSSTPLIFVANSVGCPIARYYAQNYPGTVAALLLLDSYMTDTNFVDLYPDPDAPGYDKGKLPGGITTKDIRAAREGMGKLFRPDVVNKEGFWRGNITSLLPHPYSPKLVASPPVNNKDGIGPFLTVVGHDWDVFAEESLRMKGMTREVAMEYTNPAWGRYNEGLLGITEAARGKRMIAERAGHFVQRDRPDLVAEEVRGLFEKITELEM
ncbi:hypothetical protein ABW19_dt0207168 [Dactylella cylindrospora]|nr:hypothetical protein ABW19_dt0207168 [Dactylella cylindrospora]